jgi:hypothetical protein
MTGKRQVLTGRPGGENMGLIACPPPALASLRTIDFAGMKAYNEVIRVINGNVVRGALVFEGATLEEGAKVTILVREGEETFVL